jgi:hypothetical protein
VRASGAFGPASAVESTLGEYADAGVKPVVVRFAASDQREQFERLTRAVDRERREAPNGHRQLPFG